MAVTWASKHIPTLSCSQESIEHNEPLRGTAPRAEVWFALEYPGRWEKKAFEQSSIAAEIKDHVNAQLKLIPESRLLLIKQRSSGSAADIRFFASVASADPPALYRIELSDYSDLLSLDLVSIAAQHPRYVRALSEEPVFVICTNGLRDQCCALQGPAAYAALSAEFGDLIWESTHHGGHRFAANLLALPGGLSFGRLRADSALAVVRVALDGKLDLGHFRGRSVYDEPVQAGEILLRWELGLDAVGALKLTESNPAGDGRWELTFAEPSGQAHRALLERSEGPEQIHLSCGDAKTAPMAHFQLLEHTTA